MGFRIFVSSAYRMVSLDIMSTKSLMYMIKRVGPRTEPCGTDEVTGAQSEETLPRTTLCLRFVRKDFIHFRRFPLIPYLSSL